MITACDKDSFIGIAEVRSNKVSIEALCKMRESRNRTGCKLFERSEPGKRALGVLDCRMGYRECIVHGVIDDRVHGVVLTEKASGEMDSAVRGGTTGFRRRRNGETVC